MTFPMEQRIRESEAKWLSLLYEHCRELFTGVFLPSHDETHHARVWSHARSLLLMLDHSGIKFPEPFPDELIITSFFHDVGLVRTPGEQHGIEGRKICEEFFSGPGTTDPGNESLGRMLHAIEHHDDKSLKSVNETTGAGDTPDLLDLLTTADDMDAFGLLGIYRYAEIYLLRGTEPSHLPGLVSTNVRDRFENLRNRFGNNVEFIREQEARFRLVYDFYLKLAQAYASKSERPSWEPVLVDLIRDSLRSRQNLLLSSRILPPKAFGSGIRDWFRALDSENRSGV